MRYKFDSNKYKSHSVRIIKDIANIPEIIDDWKKLIATESYKLPDIDPEHFLYELESLGTKSKPYIICLIRNGSIVSMIIGRHEETYMTLKVGYLIFYHFKVKRILIYHRGIIGDKGIDSFLILYYALRHSLQSGEADLAVINHLDCDAEIYYLLKQFSPFLSISSRPRIDANWVIDLPSSTEAFFMRQSRTQRHKLKRKIRNLEKSYKIQVIKYSDEKNLSKAITDSALVSSRTYKDALEIGFHNDQKTREYLKVIAQKGWLRFYVLYIDTEPVAYEYGLIYGDVLFLKSRGFDYKWRNVSPGTVLFLKILQDLIEKEGIKKIDFGFGDAEHKRQFGTQCFQTRSILIFPYRFYSIILSLAYHVTHGLWKVGIYITKSFKIESKFKRVWKAILITAKHK